MSNRLPFIRLAIWFVCSRLFLLLVAFLSLKFLPPGIYEIKPGILNSFSHWDSGWYLNVAQHGYSYHPPEPSNTASFPLYPLLMWLLGFLTSDLRVAGYLLSNGLLFVSCLLLWKLVARDYNTKLADRAVLFLVICPVTVFYSSIYTESLFLFLTLACAYCAGDRRWLAAGAGGFFAALARAPGILLSVLIAVEYGTRLLQGRAPQAKGRPFAWGEAARVMVALTLPELGLGCYALYLHAKFGDALLFVHAQEAGWSRHFIPFWELPWGMPTEHPLYVVWISASILVGLVLFGLGCRFRLRPSHLAIAAVFVFLDCSTSNAESIPRYLSVVFPLLYYHRRDLSAPPPTGTLSHRSLRRARRHLRRTLR